MPWDQVRSPALSDLYSKKARLIMWNTKTLRFDKQGHFGCSLCIGISIIITTLFLLFIKPRINLANTVPKYLSQPAVESQKHSGPEI